MSKSARVLDMHTTIEMSETLELLHKDRLGFFWRCTGTLLDDVISIPMFRYAILNYSRLKQSLCAQQNAQGAQLLNFATLLLAIGKTGARPNSKNAHIFEKSVFIA